MRIIDKNNDYYDYLTDPTDTCVFDRRGSIVWGKLEFARRYLEDQYTFNRDNKYRFLLLQNGATFWLILATMLNTDYYKMDYTLELLDTWKDYNKPNALMQIKTVHFNNEYQFYDYKLKDYRYEDIKKAVPTLRSFIMTNDCKYTNYIKVWKWFDFEDGKNQTHERPYFPILRATGIPTVIDPDSMFNAIEEYFSIEKTASESTVAKGTTNKDKIVNHGFDVKTSFRGKVK